MSRPRILQLSNSDYAFRYNLRRLVEDLNADGWDVTCVAGDFGHTDALRDSGFTIQTVPFKRTANPLGLLPTYGALRRLFAEQQFDIVHIHNPLMGYVGRAAARAARCQNVVFTAHGFFFHDQMPQLKLAAFYRLERLVSSWTRFLFTQSAEDAGLAISQRWFSPDDVLVIGNGVDTAWLDPDRISREQCASTRTELGIPANHKVVTTIGRLTREKGISELIEAAGQVARTDPNTTYVIVGDPLPGDRRPMTVAEVTNLAQEHGVDGRILVTGFRSDIPELLAMSDLFVLPSYREGMPRSVIEAMAMARPVVVTNIRGCREEVSEGVEGFLVPAQNSTALAERILELLHDPELARRMGALGRQRVLAQFDEAQAVRLQIDRFHELLAEGRHGDRLKTGL